MVTTETTARGRDARFIRLAYAVATFSKDPSTCVGAVIVGRDPREVAIGYNGFPPGIADDHRLHDREQKYRLIQHAERNAIDNARFNLYGSTLYVTMFPCLECAKSVVSQGIARIVCPTIERSPGAGRKHWASQHAHVIDLFSEAMRRLECYNPDRLGEALGPLAEMLDDMSPGWDGRFQCEARQYEDTMRCARCEMIWYTNDPDPPRCSPRRTA